MPKNEQPIIFTTPEFAEQGRQIVKKTGAQFGNEKMRFTTFPDGTPDSNFHDLQNDIRDRVVWWLGDLSDMSKLFAQYAALGAIARFGAEELNIIFPYFSVGTMERIVTSGDVVTAKAMMRLLGSLPSCRKSKNEITVFDIHDPREQFYGDDEFFLQTASWMAERAKELPEDAVIVFPDLGAKKRFGSLFGKRPKIVFEKIRNPANPTAEEKELNIIEGQQFVKNGNLFLVDDLVMTGGTLKGASRILRALGAKSVTSLFTHPVFPGDPFEKFVAEFDAVITSDTIPLQAKKMSALPGVEIRSIVPQVSEMIIS